MKQRGGAVRASKAARPLGTYFPTCRRPAPPPALLLQVAAILRSSAKMADAKNLRRWIFQNKLRAICESRVHPPSPAPECRRSSTPRPSSATLVCSPTHTQLAAPFLSPSVSFWATGLGVSLAYQWTR